MDLSLRQWKRAQAKTGQLNLHRLMDLPNGLLYATALIKSVLDGEGHAPKTTRKGQAATYFFFE